MISSPWRCALAGFGIAVISAIPAAAQTPIPVSIDEAIARAINAAPLVAEAEARAAAAEATIRSRESATRPTLTATSQFLRTNHVDEFGIPQPNGTTRILFPDIPSNYRLRAEAAIPLYTGGRARSLVDAAALDADAVRAERRTVEADVRLDAARAYWTVVTARAQVDVLEQALARADESLRVVGERVAVGLLPPNEVASARAQRARQMVRLIQARHEAAVADADLARLLGAAPGETFIPTSPLDEPLAGVDAIVDAVAAARLAAALEKRPEREVLDRRAAALRATADAALAVRRPIVSAIAAIEPARPNSRFVPRMDEWRTSWDLGVQLTWTLWDGGRADADAAAASANATAVDHRRRHFDSLVALELEQRVGELRSMREALVAANEAVAAATEAHRVVRERFDAGVAGTTDVLDAEVAQAEAELERTRVQAAIRIAEARLVRAAGGR